MKAAVPLASTLVCPKCGRSYVCDPGGDCWCMHLEVKLPVPAAGTEAKCRCPCEFKESEFEELVRENSERKNA